MAKEIRGIVVPVVTPFYEDETINEDALRRIVDYLIDAGVHGLFPSGSQGELWALSTEEKMRVMDVVIEQAAGRVFVMPSTGAVTTRRRGLGYSMIGRRAIGLKRWRGSQPGATGLIVLRRTLARVRALWA